MKKVSIIVPVYNMESRIRRCLDSLVNQTLKDIEIIIINDGSKDNSIKIIREYEKKYKNIVVIDRENKGISATRNEGIEKAKGEYIAFVDSDDYVDLDMYEILYNSVLENDSEIAICNYKIFNEVNDEIIYQNISTKCNINNLYDNPKMIYKIDYAPWNKLYKRELWNDLKFPIGLKYEDLEAVLKVFLLTKKVVYVNKYLYNYLDNPTGQTATVNKRVYDIFKILLNLKPVFIDKPKKLKIAYKKLCVNKVFIYNHYILNTRDRNFSKEYMDEGYKFIKSNFDNWRLSYICDSISFTDFIMRLIQIIPFVYYRYIDFRTRKK